MLIIAYGSDHPVQAADVGIAVNIRQSGFYGRDKIGGDHHPQVLFRQRNNRHRVQGQGENHS